MYALGTVMVLPIAAVKYKLDNQASPSPQVIPQVYTASTETFTRVILSTLLTETSGATATDLL
jgi:hypothetical protein